MDLSDKFSPGFTRFFFYPIDMRFPNLTERQVDALGQPIILPLVFHQVEVVGTRIRAGKGLWIQKLPIAKVWVGM